MRRFNAISCCEKRFNDAEIRHSLASVFGFLAIIGMVNSACAADQADSKTKSNRENATATDNDIASVTIPESLRALNLTAKQKDQIQHLIHEYDESIDNVWRQFRDRYMHTIRLETSMLAAIEDHLTDTQRVKIRDHRRRTARHMKVRTETEKPDVTVKSTSNDEKPAVEVDLANVGVALSSEQEATADKIHQQYRTHFKSLNREIHSLHNRLVALEAEKLAEIEQVLTKEQLDQLRKNRQTAGETTKITSRRGE